MHDFRARSRPFKQVDVFTEVPFKGNPVAVVLDGDGLSTTQMQSIASWTNLSETTFVCAPRHADADYRLRIFTPKTELPFAGHPTIGSAWAVLEGGLTPKNTELLCQECEKGLITVRIAGEKFFLALPEPAFTTPDEVELAAAVAGLGIRADAIENASVVDVGAVWLTLQLRSAPEVLAVEPRMDLLAALGGGLVGVTVFGLHDPGDPTAIEVRSFAPADGVPEDPVCGSGNGCVAALIRRHGVLGVRDYVASQGRCLGRDGRVDVEYGSDGTIWVGGYAVTCIDGSIRV